MTASSESVRARIRAVEGTGMRTFWEPEPLVWARTEGCHVWDAEGRPYLDLYAGFAVANVGYCHPRVTAAIREQALHFWPEKPKAAFAIPSAAASRSELAPTTAAFLPPISASTGFG